MGDRGTAEGKVRAGLFEINLASGELFKNGRKIALQQQPFRLLAVLIERSGELVTREELQSQLWPSDTYGAFDEGLNTAIRKLRTAFGDSADNPRFIETVPRRGYRFIAPLAREGNGTTVSEVKEEALEADRVISQPPTPVVEPAQKPERKVATNRKPLLWLAAALLLCIGLAITWTLRPAVAPPRVARIRQLTRMGNLQWWIYTDGPCVYFSTGTLDDHRQWRSISIEGGESAPVTEWNADWFPQRFSPNGSELLTLRGQNNQPPFWKVSFPSGSMQELDPSSIHGLSVGDATWSPNGQRIAFIGDTSLFVMTNDGGDVRKVAEFTGEPYYPSWSPDGQKIRVNVNKWAGNFSVVSRAVMEVDVATGAAREVLLGIGSARGMEWLGGGNYFLFTSNEAGVNDLWAIRETSGGFRKVDRQPVRLTSGPISFTWPVMSRDGKTIFAVGVQPRASMQRYNSQTGTYEPFLEGLSGDHITYSRDGEWFAYIAYPERTLWRCRASGKDCLQLAFMPLHMDGPVWSPDGKLIAFNAKGDGKISKGYIVSANGGVSQPLFANASTGEEGLAWSPDGKRLMYNEVSPSAPSHMRILDLTTKQIAEVPNSSGLEGSWSPDGNSIAAWDQDRKARLFDFRTQQWSNIGEIKGDAWWSTDSQYLYFHTLNRIPLNVDQDGIFRLRLSDHHVEKVAGVPPFKMIGTWGVGTGHTPDETPLVLKDMTTSDLYALDLDIP